MKASLWDKDFNCSIVGSTGTGKSSLALSLSREYSVDVWNMDSVQVFKELNIGSAKPTQEELSVCPHYLYGYMNVIEENTVGLHLKALENLKLEFMPQGSSFNLFVGGSGFYQRAFERGLSDVPKSDPLVIEGLEKLKDEKGLDFLYSELDKLDHDAAVKIYPQDAYRIIRALAVIKQTGKKWSILNKKRPVEINLCKVGLHCSRDHLAERLSRRLDQMIDRGLIDEVFDLKDYWHTKPLQSVGYKETVAFLKSNIASMDILKYEILKNTLYLAKRQKTWLKREENIEWFDIENKSAMNQALSYIKSSHSKF